MEFTNDREVRVYDLSPAQACRPKERFSKNNVFKNLIDMPLRPSI